MINADTTRPKFKNLFNPDHKWLVDQPDAIYLTATISTDFAYVIEGKNFTPCTPSTPTCAWSVEQGHRDRGRDRDRGSGRESESTRAREREAEAEAERERETALVGMFIHSCCLVCNCNADNAITIAVTLGVPLVQARSLIRCTSRTPSTHTHVAVAGRRTCCRRQGILGHLSQGLR